ncbi:hypothetical protein L6R52_22270 [Myxococcota bacterium]|nr:hypothetical protein [Myxococcota bacterium]
MTFIRNLNRQRNAAQIGQAGPVENGAEPVKQDGGVVPAKEPELRGGAGKPVAKKAQGLGGAALRQTVGDLFAAAEKLGMPGATIAKYASGMDQHVAVMKDCGARIERALAGLDQAAKAQAQALPARLVLSMAKGLGALDQTSAGIQIRVLVEAATELLEGPKKLSGAQLRAVEVLAHAAGQLSVAEPAAELKKASKTLATKNDAIALEAAVSTLNGAMNQLVGASDSATRGPLFRAALETGLAAAGDLAKDVNAVVDQAIANANAQLSDAQKDFLRGFAGDVRAKAAEVRATADAKNAEVANLKAQFDQNPAAAAFGPQRARVDAELAPAAQALWYGAMNQWAGQPAAVATAVAQVQVEHLAHAQASPPTADLVNQISGAVAQLAQQPGVTPEMMARLAKDHVAAVSPERLPGTLAILVNVVAQANANGAALAGEHELATVANALIGRTDAFAQANGPVNQLIGALAAAGGDAAARTQVLKHGARFADAIAKCEPGPARDHLQASFAEDVKTVAKKGLDLASLAAAYKSIPEEAIAHFVAVADRRGVDADKFLDQMMAVYKHARGNKEHIRAIRNFVTLADRDGIDVPAFVTVLNSTKLKGPAVTRTIGALLQENNLQFTAEQMANATGMLQRGENVAGAIEAKLHEGMVKKLNLDQLLNNAQVKVTDRGYKEVTGSLAQFFSLGANSATVNKDLLKGMLIATLEDRYSQFRFTTPPAARQLEVLAGDQVRLWKQDSVMTHVRFDANGKAEFDKRVTSGAGIAKGISERMTASWGDLVQLKQKHAELTAQLRQVDKNDLAARRPLVKEIGELPAKIEAMEWAQELAAMTPATTTPLRFSQMADKIPSLARMLGPGMEAALNELTWTVRIDDLSFSQVVTNDGPDLSTMYKLAVMQCLRGWPQDTALMPYLVDANKRMIVTKNQAGEERRAIMRIVTRTDEGHVGEPMLVLERSYPDNQAEEEKQRLVEHMLRRAVEMGISAAYPTEYYWDASKTGRRLLDMNAVLEDLNRRYDTTSEIKVTKVTNRAGNNNPEYIDSAPLNGAADAGNVQMRRYNGLEDKTYENKFLILTPKH